jgi:hypothetical protein
MNNWLRIICAVVLISISLMSLGAFLAHRYIYKSGVIRLYNMSSYDILINGGQGFLIGK